MINQLRYEKTPSVQEILQENVPFSEKYPRLQNAARERMNSDSQLYRILSKSEPYADLTHPVVVLGRNELPPISTKFQKSLYGIHSKIPEEYMHDGYVYLFRGDYPGLEKKGIYSYRFYEIHTNLDQMLEQLKNEPILNHMDTGYGVRNKLEEMMWMHSNSGGENFVSTTTKFTTAKLHPLHGENAGVVYVLKVPIQQAFVNYVTVCRGDEKEILVADYVFPENIIETINPVSYADVDIRDFVGR